MNATSATAKSRSGRWATIGVVGIAGLVALVLGSIDLSARSIWLDESASISIAMQHGAAFSSAVARDGGNMAGYYALLRAIDALFGHGLVALRLPSVLAAAITSAALAYLAKRLYGQRVAAVTGLVSAVSLPAVYWSQDVRSYALLSMFVTLSYVALVNIEVSPAGTRGRRFSLALYVAASAAALYSSFIAAFVVLAQLVLIWRRGRSLRPLIAADAAVVALAIPLVVLAVHRGSGQLFWIPRPDWNSIWQVAIALSSAGFEPNFALSLAGALVAALTTAIALFAVAHAGVARRHSGDQPPSDGLLRFGGALVLTWCSIPVAATFVESYISSATFTARNLLIVLPGIALALGRFLGGSTLPRVVATGLVALLLALRLIAIVPTYAKSPENWKAAATLLVSDSAPGACLVFYPQDGRMALDYYLETAHPASLSRLRSVLPQVPLSSDQPELERYDTLGASELDSVTRTCPELWLIASHQGSSSGTSVSRVHFARFLALRTALESRYSSYATFTFGWAATVTLERLRR